MPIIVKARPGEKQDRLIARFKKATMDQEKEIKLRQYFVSQTEKRRLAEKKKWVKIRQLEKKEGLGRR